MNSPLLAILFVAFALVGIRSSWRLTRIWRRDQASRDQLLLFSFAAVSWVITAAAIYSGVLALRRHLGFEALPWAPFVSAIVASVILLIPPGLEFVVDQVARRTITRALDSARKPDDDVGPTE